MIIIRRTPYIFALALALTSCQGGWLEDDAVNDSTINYSIVSRRHGLNINTCTKSPASGIIEENVGGFHYLCDGRGSVSIPMVRLESGCENLFVPYSDWETGTRGTLVNTSGDEHELLSQFTDIVSTFTVEAFAENGDQQVSQSVTWSGSAWAATPLTYWPQAMQLGFLAYANLPEGQSADIAADLVSTQHTVPADAADQTDILFGHYIGDGGNTGTAEICFEHPLTAVRFLRGEIDEDLVVKSISLEGVAKSGTASMNYSGTITWSDVSEYDLTVSQSDDSGLGLSDISGQTNQIIGEPFIIIPQNLADNNVKVTVTFTDGTEVFTSINAGYWEAGKTNTYSLGYTNQVVLFNLSVNGLPLDGREFEFEFEGGSEDIDIVSIANDRLGHYIGDIPWTAELSFEGESGNETWVQLDKMSSEGGEDNVLVSSVINSEIDVVQPSDSWNSLRNATPQGTQASRVDLSNSGETANCYLVHAPGYYKLPLVYGNARKDGNVDNVTAYKPSGFLQFTDHNGNGISNPYIYNAYTPASCCLVWQDEPGLVKNVSLSNDGHFLEFDIDRESIIEGNAVVAVRDASGNILWSWHIWVTDYVMGTGDGTIKIATPVKPSDGKRNVVDYTFAGRPLGFCMPKTVLYKGGKNYARCIVTITQEGNEDNPVTFTVYNKARTMKAGPNESHYQWGRKDPMPGAFYEGIEDYYADGANKPLYYDDSAFTFGQDASRQTRAYSIRNPHKLIYHYNANSSEEGDWEDTQVQRLNSWNATSNLGGNAADFKLADYTGAYTSVKTVYDPSPVGYKVPVQYPFLLFVPRVRDNNDNPILPVPIDGEYVDGDVDGCWINATNPRVFFPRTGIRTQGEVLDNKSWSVFSTCSPELNEKKSPTFGFKNNGEGVPNNMLGYFIATAVQPIREETVEARDMQGEILFQDNFGSTAFSSVASYDKAGISDCRPYNFKPAIDYAGEAYTSVSTTSTTNMSGGHLRYSSNKSVNTSTITIENIRTFGAPKVTLTFDAYISSNTYISTHTVSVGGLNAQTFTSKSGNSFTFTIDGDDPVDIVFNIKHNNSTNTGTVGIDNVKLTFNY